MADPAPRVEAVVFDWGGTLTPWHTIDFDEESIALAAAVLGEHDVTAAATALRAACDVVWGRSRDDHTSATVADVFSEAGLEHDESRLSEYHAFWDPHTLTDPDVPDLFAGLRERGIKVGVLSNTLWSRALHEEIFRRDGVLDLIDGAVYTSEIPWTKPHPEAFRAALAAVSVDDPGRAVYVGDRPFEDVYGAQAVGMRAVLVPHSDIPAVQRGHTDGTPDAVVERLADLLAVVDGWR